MSTPGTMVKKPEHFHHIEWMQVIHTPTFNIAQFYTGIMGGRFHFLCSFCYGPVLNMVELTPTVPLHLRPFQNRLDINDTFYAGPY